MTLKLDAKIRTLVGKKTEGIRQEGKIPAVLYGHGIENKNLEIDYNVFEKVFKEAGESTIIDLNIDGDVVKILVADIQFDSVSGRYTHVDFHQIRMDEKVSTNVEIKLVGEPKAVKELGGILLHNISEVEIKCLPTDLINEIEVDVSGLDNFGDTITIGDLKISDKNEIVGHELGDIVASVSEPREEKVEEPVVETPVEGEKTEETKSAEEKTESENK